MKHWTKLDEELMSAALARKTAVMDRLREDIEQLPDIAIGGLVANYLQEHGQVVLDMLLVHFEPSPRAAFPGQPPAFGTGAAGEFTPIPAKCLETWHARAEDNRVKVYRYVDLFAVGWRVTEIQKCFVAIDAVSEAEALRIAKERINDLPSMK